MKRYNLCLVPCRTRSSLIRAFPRSLLAFACAGTSNNRWRSCSRSTAPPPRIVNERLANPTLLHRVLNLLAWRQVSLQRMHERLHGEVPPRDIVRLHGIELRDLHLVTLQYSLRWIFRLQGSHGVKSKVLPVRSVCPLCVRPLTHVARRWASCLIELRARGRGRRSLLPFQVDDLRFLVSLWQVPRYLRCFLARLFLTNSFLRVVS